MGDKGEGGVKNLKKWAKSFMDGPLYTFLKDIYIFCLFCFCTFFLGNFVHVFECLVCSRVARNSEMMALGFGKYDLLK